MDEEYLWLVCQCDDCVVDDWFEVEFDVEYDFLDFECVVVFVFFVELV